MRMKHLAKVVIPGPIYSALQNPYRKARQNIIASRLAVKAQYFGFTHYCPICKSYLRRLLPYGITPRPNAMCPVCNSLERHRLISLFIRQRTDLFSPKNKRMLHVAPEECLTRIFRSKKFIEYISADLGPYAMLRMNLTGISFPTETFDVILASSVFQYIVDDREAMREVFRVLKPGGWAIMHVPIGREVTFEDQRIVDPEERERVFGHRHHVRIYGKDYYERLRQVGFTVHREKLPTQHDSQAIHRLGLSPSEEIAFCIKA